MPLPILEKIQPQFEIVVPSTEAVAIFRPFLVKEEKILLIALESKEEKTMLDAMMQVIKSCALSPIKVENLASFDLEYIFLQLRARSVNEIVELAYKCRNEIQLTPDQVAQRSRKPKRKLTVDPETEPIDEEPVFGTCDNIVKLKLNLDAVKVHIYPEHKRQIMLTPTLGVTLRYPNFQMAKASLNRPKGSGINEALLTVGQCIESVFDEESVYTNFTPKEMQEWIEKLTQNQFTMLQEFFETMPKLAHDVNFECNVCGYKEIIHLEGLASFFA